eukprot:TRINITY_DN23062_c0_g1_i2.p1 TRINITY_DN23062_c0_g1~~TRINITY_DN23062_c0_g1_i2.p1  ORF type:complete len:110 (-),score=8.01 TRINITY_DN23062_c0_g1_i2:144-437(-)
MGTYGYAAPEYLATGDHPFFQRISCEPSFACQYSFLVNTGHVNFSSLYMQLPVLSHVNEQNSIEVERYLLVSCLYNKNWKRLHNLQNVNFFLLLGAQ